MFNGVGASCRILHFVVSDLHVRFSELITAAGKNRAFFLPSITCNYEVSVCRGFLFLLAMGRL